MTRVKTKIGNNMRISWEPFYGCILWYDTPDPRRGKQIHEPRFLWARLVNRQKYRRHRWGDRFREDRAYRLAGVACS